MRLCSWLLPGFGKQGIHAEVTQHPRERDQRQADTGGGVIGIHLVHQGDAQALCFRTARRVIGPLAQ